MNVMKKGLVMEGGAMRGMFTCGVTDVFMEHGIVFDGAIGVSAGAAFGCNYKSGQIGRAFAYNRDYCQDKRYGSMHSLLKTGNIYDPDFCYGEIPNRLNKFDVEAYESNPMDFYVVCTDVETGYGIYHNCLKGDAEDIKWIRASASMPLVSQIVEIDGHKLLDGGIADSIPIRKMEELGYDRNVVILTQPLHFKKTQANYYPLAKIVMYKYPELIKRMAVRPYIYNATTEYLRKKELNKEILVIRPPMLLEISGVIKDPKELERVYEIGRKTGEKYVENVKEYLELS